MSWHYAPDPCRRLPKLNPILLANQNLLQWALPTVTSGLEISFVFQCLRVSSPIPLGSTISKNSMTPPERIQPSSWRGAVAFLLTYCIAMALFFRGVLRSGFDRGFSDRADGIIEISILEHWRNVLIGAAPWNVTNAFYPYPATLGYNDGYFLYGLVYSGWRVVADPFLADTLNLFTFKTIGFVAAYALVARSLRWGRGAGLFVALVFTNANGLMVQAGHAQLQSIALLPVAIILAVEICRAEGAGRRRVACSAAAGLALLLAAWLLTAFYMAWFTIFFGACSSCAGWL